MSIHSPHPLYTDMEMSHSHAAYPLYERFRPGIPEGKLGWGAKGELDLVLIGRMVSEKG